MKILVIGGIHGDEPASVLAVLTWMKLLQEDKAATPSIHWRMLPLANPDGFLASPPRRTNGNRVDLNRNFATHDWTKRAREHWKRNARSDPRRFPGTFPASEPETRRIQEEIREFSPSAIIAVHTPYGIVDFDGPPALSPHRIGTLQLKRIGTFPGSLGSYASKERNIPVVTLELSTSPHDLNQQNLHHMWHDIRAWLNRQLQEAHALRKSGRLAG